jgi:hypothetical protein
MTLTRYSENPANHSQDDCSGLLGLDSLPPRRLPPINALCLQKARLITLFTLLACHLALFEIIHGQILGQNLMFS